MQSRQNAARAERNIVLVQKRNGPRKKKQTPYEVRLNSPSSMWALLFVYWEELHVYFQIFKFKLELNCIAVDLIHTPKHQNTQTIKHTVSICTAIQTQAFVTCWHGEFHSHIDISVTCRISDGMVTCTERVGIGSCDKNNKWVEWSVSTSEQVIYAQIVRKHMSCCV